MRVLGGSALHPQHELSCSSGSTELHQPLLKSPPPNETPKAFLDDNISLAEANSQRYAIDTRGRLAVNVSEIHRYQSSEENEFVQKPLGAFIDLRHYTGEVPELAAVKRVLQYAGGSQDYYDASRYTTRVFANRGMNPVDIVLTQSGGNQVGVKGSPIALVEPRNHLSASELLSLIKPICIALSQTQTTVAARHTYTLPKPFFRSHWQSHELAEALERADWFVESELSDEGRHYCIFKQITESNFAYVRFPFRKPVTEMTLHLDYPNPNLADLNYYKRKIEKALGSRGKFADSVSRSVTS